MLKQKLNSDYEERYVKVDQILHFYVYLMRRQFFHDCNKRTATLFVNLSFNYYDLNCFLWFPTLEELNKVLSRLKLCYEIGDFGTDSAFVDYISSQFLVDLSV